MHRCDGGLELVGAGHVATQARAHQRVALGDGGAIPQRPVLIGEPHQAAVGRGARRPPCVGEQHQRQQASCLRLVGHQFDEHPGKPDRLGGQVGAGELDAGAGGVALVEHEVDRGEHGRQAVGQLVRCGDAVGDVVVADLALGAHQPLRHRGLGHEEGPGDLVRLETAEQAQGERHLSVGRQRGVAAQEHQPQLVVGHHVDVAEVAVHRRLRIVEQFRGAVARPFAWTRVATGRSRGCGPSW